MSYVASKAQQQTAAPVVTAVLVPALLQLFPGAPRRIELNAATVAEMIDQLDARWPGMRDRLVDSTPRIRRHINVFMEGERAALQTPLAPNSEVYIITAISGG